MLTGIVLKNSAESINIQQITDLIISEKGSELIDFR